MRIIYFFSLAETLRALYLGDNDFENLSTDIKNLKNLQIVSVIYYNLNTYLLNINISARIT